MMVHLPRHARRRMKRLVGDAETTIQADAKFFRRFPERHHRVRLADRAEIEQFSIIAGRPYPHLDSDQLAFAIVRQIAPGVRLKAVVAGPAVEAGEEQPEALAAALWAEWLRRNPHAAEQEAQLEAAARLPGGPLHDGGVS